MHNIVKASCSSTKPRRDLNPEICLQRAVCYQLHHEARYHRPSSGSTKSPIAHQPQRHLRVSNFIRTPHLRQVFHFINRSFIGALGFEPGFPFGMKGVMSQAILHTITLDGFEPPSPFVKKGTQLSGTYFPRAAFATNYTTRSRGRRDSNPDKWMSGPPFCQLNYSPNTRTGVEPVSKGPSWYPTKRCYRRFEVRPP